MARSHARRRDFLKAASASLAGMVLGEAIPGASQPPRKRDFKISLAAWSLHREVFGGKLKVIDAFKIIREEFNLDGFELVNTMLEAPTAGYVSRLRKQAETHNLAIPLIMCDDEGAFGHEDPKEREKAVRNHAKWVYIASDLGCHSIRVNWRGEAKDTEHDSKKAMDFIARSASSFQNLVELGKKNSIGIIIENHGGPSSYPDILTGLIKAVHSPNFGTLPDFGNFPADVDRYDAVDKMMSHAKAVSAKCYDFGPDGNETKIDFERMLKIVVDQHNDHGFIGIEYEGNRLGEREGTKACRDLLIKLRG